MIAKKPSDCKKKVGGAPLAPTLSPLNPPLRHSWLQTKWIYYLIWEKLLEKRLFRKTQWNHSVKTNKSCYNFCDKKIEKFRPIVLSLYIHFSMLGWNFYELLSSKSFFWLFFYFSFFYWFYFLVFVHFYCHHVFRFNLNVWQVSVSHF